MDQKILKDEKYFRSWVLNFSNVLLEIGNQFDLSEFEIYQLKNFVKSVENDLLKYEMGISQDLLYKHHQKKLLIKNISELSKRIKKHPNYSARNHGEKFKF